MGKKECIFKDILHTCKSDGDLIKPTSKNLEAFKVSSKTRKDEAFSDQSFACETALWMHRN